MVDLYFWTTPNGYKVLLFLEETGLPYTIRPVDIGKGEQFAPDFLKISPNNRIPAIVDHAPADGGQALTLFESGAILLYLAEKTGQFIPSDRAGRVDTLQWLFWQMGGLGPMAGQTHHFRNYAPERVPYAIKRYVDETARLYAVLDRQLADREFVAGSYTIADMAIYPWVVSHADQDQNLDDFRNIKRWFETIADRSGTQRAYDNGRAINSNPALSEEARRFLFGQSARTIDAEPATRSVHAA